MSNISYMLWTIKAGDTGSEQSGDVIRNDIVKTDRHDEPLKERPLRRNKKKEKENMEKTSKPSIKSKIEKRLLLLPLETSIIALFFVGAAWCLLCCMYSSSLKIWISHFYFASLAQQILCCINLISFVLYDT